MSQDEAEAADTLALERGRWVARVELLEWRLKKISEISAGLAYRKLSSEDRAFSIGRIEELSK